MDINNAVKIILRDIEEARSILDEVGSTTNITEIELVNARLHSAAEMLSLLPRMTGKTEPLPVVEEIKIEKPAEIINKKEKTSEAEVKKEIPAETEKPQPQETVQSSRLIFADKFDKDNVLGEQLSAKPDNDLLTTLSAKPVEDITTAIGINDRFFFTRELFGGRQEEYYRAVSRLNKAMGLEEAMDILDSSVVGNPDVLAYTAFTDLLKRKFPVK